MKNENIETMDLKQAAEFLKMHPVTLQAKAKAGEIQLQNQPSAGHSLKMIL
jgi:hypothetical protein